MGVGDGILCNNHMENWDIQKNLLVSQIWTHIKQKEEEDSPKFLTTTAIVSYDSLPQISSQKVKW